jgi:hypothetical protein
MSLLEPFPNGADGLSDDETTALRRLAARLVRHRTRNRIRTVYYNGRNQLKDLGYSLPPIAKDVEIVVGWPEKAVEGLANRVVLDGVTTQDGSDLGKQVGDLLDANDLAQTAENAHTDALVHSCSFIAALQGMPDRGEPAAIIQEFPADVATGTWDSRIHGLTEALLFDVDEDETYGRQIRACYLMLPGRLVGISRDGWRWRVYARTDWQGRLPVELLAYRPDSKRPFGRSRISRTVMSLTDSAVRTFLRSEVQAELYSVPPRYFLGVTENMFRRDDGTLRPRWQIMLDQVLALPRDKQGNLPQVGTFTQASFEPHSAQLRQTALMFAAATSLPPDSMGVLTDNPSSAEAIDKAVKELCLNAESCQRRFGPAWERIIATAARIAGDGQAAAVSSQWRNPATPSRAAAADAAVKLVGANILPADSDVTYDMLDLSDRQRQTLRREQRAKRAQQALDRIDQTITQQQGADNANSQPAAEDTGGTGQAARPTA